MLLHHLFTEEQNGIRDMIRKFVDKEIMLNEGGTDQLATRGGRRAGLIVEISEPRQNLLRLAQPIIHAHLLEHGLGLFQVFERFWFSAVNGVKLSETEISDCCVWPHFLFSQYSDAMQN